MRAALPILALSAISLSACTTTFGEYDVLGVHMVRGLPEGARDPRPDENFARVMLASDFDMTAGSGAVSAYADRCPFVEAPSFRDDGSPSPTANLYSYGPYDMAGREIDKRRPLAPAADGRYRYVVYLPVTRDKWRERLAGETEVCAVIVSPNIPRRRLSEPFRVPLR